MGSLLEPHESADPRSPPARILRFPHSQRRGCPISARHALSDRRAGLAAGHAPRRAGPELGAATFVGSGRGCHHDANHHHPPATPGKAQGLTWRYGTPTATTPHTARRGGVAALKGSFFCLCRISELVRTSKLPPTTRDSRMAWAATAFHLRNSVARKRSTSPIRFVTSSSLYSSNFP